MIGDLLVIRYGNTVVGGARLIQKAAVPATFTLPIENDGFILDNHLPAFGLIYASRLVWVQHRLGLC